MASCRQSVCVVAPSTMPTSRTCARCICFAFGAFSHSLRRETKLVCSVFNEMMNDTNCAFLGIHVDDLPYNIAFLHGDGLFGIN